MVDALVEHGPRRGPGEPAERRGGVELPDHGHRLEHDAGLVRKGHPGQQVGHALIHVQAAVLIGESGFGHDGGAFLRGASERA